MSGASATFWILWGILVASLPVWFCLVSALHKRLASTHPEKYRQMGEPQLVRNNRPGMGVRLFKFIFTREDRPLNDPQLSRLTAIMLAFSICYFAIFLFLSAPILLGLLLVTLGVRGS